MRLVEGRSAASTAHWRFVPLGAERLPHRVLAAATSSPAARSGALLAPLFDGIADSMVDAFVRRAAQVHGQVEVVYALPERRAGGALELPAGATLRDALAASAAPSRSAAQAFGIFGKRAGAGHAARRRRPGRDLPAARDRSEGSAPAARRAQGASALSCTTRWTVWRARGGLLRDLRVLEVIALALRVGARDALAALERCAAMSCARAQFSRLACASCSVCACFSRSFCASSWRLRNALPPGLSGLSPSLLRRRRRAPARMPPAAAASSGVRLHARRRHVAVAHLAVLVDPLVLLGRWPRRRSSSATTNDVCS